MSVIVFVSYDGSRCARLLSALNLSNPLQLQLFSEMSRKYFVREIRRGCGKRCSGLLLCSLHLPHMSCVMLGSTHVTIYELNITLSCSVIPRRVKLQTQDFPQHTPPPLPARLLPPILLPVGKIMVMVYDIACAGCKCISNRVPCYSFSSGLGNALEFHSIVTRFLFLTCALCSLHRSHPDLPPFFCVNLKMSYPGT